MTLPNGEVIPDLNGEWEALFEFYGPWTQGPLSNIIKITQTGNSFVGIRMMDDRYYAKGWESFKGELDKSGFKKIAWKTMVGVSDARGQISEGGNKVIIDDGEKVKVTLTRTRKTITLPSGDVVYDLNGEWDVLNENYGVWREYGSYPNIHKITQTGSSFVGILVMNDRWYSKGWEYIRGELDKNGFKRVEIRTNLGVLDAKGQISEDGNKMLIDDGQKFKMTFTRK